MSKCCRGTGLVRSWSFCLTVLIALAAFPHRTLAAGVFVPDAPPSGGIVEVRGAVSRPGFVLLSQTELSVRQVVQQAGGVTEDAYLLGSVLLRKAMRSTPAVDILGGDPACVSFAEAQSVDGIRTVMPSDRADELVSKLRRRELVRLPVRLTPESFKASEGPAPSLIDGDVLIIPARPAYVTVAGAVARKGATLYRPGAKAEDYLDEAEATSRSWLSHDLLVLPNGESRRLSLRWWDYQPTAVPPGSLLVFDAPSNLECVNLDTY